MQSKQKHRFCLKGKESLGWVRHYGITVYTLENYSNFKNKFTDKSRGNTSFTGLSEIINTLSNQDFAGLDKFRLRSSLERIKEMHVKMNKTKKVTEMQVVWVTFSFHLFLL